jgi:HPt (histidine-containing phosphotransfer) domain-containing protein
MEMTEFSADTVDQQIYDALQELMGEQGFEEVISVFRSDTRQSLSNLQAAILTQQLDYVSSVCHKLKASGKLVGALEMARLCEQIESCADNQQHAAIVNAFTELEAEFQRVDAWIRTAKAETAIPG